MVNKRLATRALQIGGLVLGIVLPQIAVCGPYLFTKIVDSTTVDPSGEIAINNSGIVSFSAFDAIRGRLQVMTGSNGTVSTVAEVSSLFGSPDISDNGAVAFATNIGIGGTVNAVLMSTDDGLVNVSLDNGIVKVGPPRINDSGHVAFSGTPLGSQSAGFYIYKNEALQLISGAPAASDFSFNNADEVAMTQSHKISVFADSGERTVADLSGAFSGLQQGAISDSGNVAFLASFDVGGEGIVVTGPGGFTVVADNSSAFSSFADGPAINSLDAVFFIAHLRSGGDGIFFGPNAIDDKVIAAGDELFGSAVTDLFFDPKGVNDHGQVAFLAVLENGQRGVFVASPIPLPPACGLLLGGVALLGFVAGQQTGRRRPAASQ